ncbi:hypothetical protein F5Y12DRAFT_739214 [Xylaria sp. FL1777]|nr:hypothetical protein F5Y12DRAFT_739214 [Xylaria sp. FL1777]
MYIPDVHRRGGIPPDPQGEVPGAEQRQQVLSVSHVTPYSPDNSIANSSHHYLLAWVIKTISTVLSSNNNTSTSSPAEPLSPASTASLGKRANDPSPNTTTSVVAGILVTAFVILAGIFLYVYRRSIRFRQQAHKRRRHHRHHRRPSGVSKMSQGSDAAGGGGGDGGADGAAPAPDPPAEA